MKLQADILSRLVGVQVANHKGEFMGKIIEIKFDLAGLNVLKRPEINKKNGRLYSVRDSETMTAEELMDNIRDRIQKILIEKPGQNRKFVHPESKSVNHVKSRL